MFPSFLFVKMTLAVTGLEILLWNLIGKLTDYPGSILTLSSAEKSLTAGSNFTQ
jgi:hypothetical protein